MVRRPCISDWLITVPAINSACQIRKQKSPQTAVPSVVVVVVVVVVVLTLTL